VGDEFSGPYYPQVWPNASEEEVAAIRQALGAGFNFAVLARIMWTVITKRWLAHSSSDEKEG